MESRILIFVLVILPVLSVCLGITVHYVVQPMVDSLVDAVHELAKLAGGSSDRRRVASLEAEVADLKQEVRRLTDGASGVQSISERTGS